MRTEEITPEQIRDSNAFRELGLNDEEYARVVERLGRLPNHLECGLFGVLWSEHCSYKSSKLHLQKFPTTGPQVLQGPGENAGVVDLGDGTAIAFKMESHNHPSAVEPYQGAATGVGGILRDVFTMGARPIAFLNSLRFGDLADERTRYLFANVVAGIGGYGNCVGIPDVGGEAVFDPVYQHNPLVNAMCVGVLPASGMVTGAATGVGNPVFVIGSRTGRDGIHGATFASAEDPHAKERSAVQVGDPFLGKLLMEASLELIQTGAVVGIQDMGAAGLTSSSAEMASRAAGGVELNLDQVPVREAGMTPYEMMLSESQERMLVVVERGREQAAFDILKKWGLEVANIGQVTDDGLLRLRFGGQVVAEVPVAALVDEAPVYDRPHQAPEVAPGQGVPLPTPPQDFGQALLKMLSQPTLSDKRWIHRQYDTTVRSATYAGPGSDAAVILVPGSTRAVALCTDGNGRYVYLNPRRGGAIAVAEASRNIVCAGGKPLAITDCLNFGNPEKPAIMHQFVEAVEGMSEACRVLSTPVVSGNVSLYNESHGVDIYPTPVVGAVGVVEDVRFVTPNRWIAPGHVIGLLGEPDEVLDGSLFWQLAAGRAAGDAPRCDLAAEARMQGLLYGLIRDDKVRAAHDVSDGGLGVALAEMCIPTGIGARIKLPTRADDAVSNLGWLFSEAQGRVCIELLPTDVEAVQIAATAHGVPFCVLGETGGETLAIDSATANCLSLPISKLKQAYEVGIPQWMEGSQTEVPQMETTQTGDLSS